MSGALILALLAFGQFCGPNGCAAPSIPIFPSPAPQVVVPVQNVAMYSLSTEDGRWYEHADPVYLANWIAQKNQKLRADKAAREAKIAAEKAHEITKSKPSDLSASQQETGQGPVVDTVPQSLNFGVNLNGMHDPSYTGLKTNDPSIAQAILPVVVDPQSGKSVPIPESSNAPPSFDASSIAMALAVAVGVVVAGFAFKL